MKKLVLICALLSLLLCSCSVLAPEEADFGEISVPAEIPEDTYDGYDPTDNADEDGIACSNYGRDLLNDSYKKDYDTIKEAILKCQRDIELSQKYKPYAIETIIHMIECDNPGISWIEPDYTHSTNEIMQTTKIKLSYSLSAGEAKKQMDDIKAKSEEILAQMPSFTDQFAEAHFIHDELIERFDYDMAAPDRSEAYAALLNGKATCEGYAKAYQFVLHQAGIEALMAYGDAGEPHAWNVIKVNGNYYHSDLTWDDAVAYKDGVEHGYLSHDYLTMNDAQIGKTHFLRERYQEYVLPECRVSKDNFYVVNGLVVTSPEMTNIEPVLSKALSEAIDHKHTSVQIVCKSDEVYDQVYESVVKNGVLDTKMYEYLSQLANVELLGKVAEKDANSITYILQYKE